jgi:hypothetical protein
MEHPVRFEKVRIGAHQVVLQNQGIRSDSGRRVRAVDHPRALPPTWGARRSKQKRAVTARTVCGVPRANLGTDRCRATPARQVERTVALTHDAMPLGETPAARPPCAPGPRWLVCAPSSGRWLVRPRTIRVRQGEAPVRARTAGGAGSPESGSGILENRMTAAPRRRGGSATAPQSAADLTR